MKEIEDSPAVVIVDDKPDAVGHLKSSLKKKGCNVEVLGSQEETQRWMAEHIADVVLLDVNLNEYDAADRKGVDLAELLAAPGPRKSQAVSPEAALVFISRPDVIGTDSTTVLAMFNRRDDLGFRRQRLAEAYAEKDGTEEVIKIVEAVLAERGFRLSPKLPKLQGDEETLSSIDEQIREKFPKSTFLDAGVQVQRIVRALCASQFTASRELTLYRVSRGRSRSLVLSVGCGYQSGLSEFRVIKIAARSTMELEVQNYTERVPSVFAGGSYPLLIGHFANRQLAGICYSEIGKGQGLPDSLADRFWTIETSRLTHILDDLYHRTIVDPNGVRKAEWTPFFKSYTNRFFNLRTESGHYAEMTAFLTKSRAVKLDSEGLRPSSTLGVNMLLPDPARVLREQWKATGYLESVVHGDLHPDNVLMTGEENFYIIDFAHTTSHHSTLDHIVMEAMMRSQLLRSVLEDCFHQGGGEAAAKLTMLWCRAELAMAEDRWDDAILAVKDDRYSEKLVRIITVISWLRTSARRRAFCEGEEFYFAGLGMVCYSFMGLPDHAATRRNAMEVLALVSALALERRNAAGAPLLRATSDSGILDDTLMDCVDAWKGWIGKKVRGSLERLFSSADGASIRPSGEAMQSEIVTLKTNFPKFLSALEREAQHLKLKGVSFADIDSQAATVIIMASTFIDHIKEQTPEFELLTQLGDMCRRATYQLWQGRHGKG